MPRQREIERKFAVASAPAGLKRRPSATITQGYLSPIAAGVEVRLRAIGRKHMLTLKAGQGSSRTEVELPLSPAQFRALWPFTRGARLRKRRYRIPDAARKIEVDVYTGNLRGLITAEIEFPTARACHNYQPPSWLGREITGERPYANAELARARHPPRR